MSDDGGGDTGGGCDDTGVESGGNIDDSAYMDPTECTEITFTENIDYEDGYYDVSGDHRHGDIHHHVHTHHASTIPTSNGSGGIIIAILIISFLYMFGKSEFSFCFEIREANICQL